MSDTILHYGIRLALDASIMSKHMLDTLRRGYYENEEAESLASIIQANEVVMELGGGIGFLSALLAKNNQVKAVHVFEANPYLIDIIHRTHSLNGVSTCVYNEILGKNDQPVDFYIHEDFWASSTIPCASQTVVQVVQSSFQSRLDEIKPTLAGKVLNMYSTPSVRKVSTTMSGIPNSKLCCFPISTAIKSEFEHSETMIRYPN
jgi:hypothetical protein